MSRISPGRRKSGDSVEFRLALFNQLGLSKPGELLQTYMSIRSDLTAILVSSKPSLCFNGLGLDLFLKTCDWQSMVARQWGRLDMRDMVKEFGLVRDITV
jgi:hypothetical protein